MRVEYKSQVTQLGATSEVTTMGIILTVPVGEKVRISSGMAFMTGIGGATTIQIQKANSSGLVIETIDLSITTGQYGQITTGVISNAATETAKQAGMISPIELGGGHIFQVLAGGTPTAASILGLRLNYECMRELLTPTAFGSGISISSEVHKVV